MKYHTKQREKLLTYLKLVSKKHITVADICEYFKQQGEEIGTTTVYRQLERMVNEGIVKKYILDANTSACFEYIGTSELGGDEACFHCKCTECGKLIHLHCDTLGGVEEHILKLHGFQMDTSRTVFYGFCEECQKNEGV